MLTAKRTTWLNDWPHVRQELKDLIEARAQRDPKFYRRYAELELAAVDRALRRLAQMAKQMSA